MKKFFKRVFWSICLTAGCFIPLWIYLIIKHALSPTGFWQKLATGVIGILFLGGIQLYLIMVWMGVLAAIWLED